MKQYILFCSHLFSNPLYFDIYVQPPNEAILHSLPQVGGTSHIQFEPEEDENEEILLEVQQENPTTYK